MKTVLLSSAKNVLKYAIIVFIGLNNMRFTIFFRKNMLFFDISYFAEKFLTFFSFVKMEGVYSFMKS